MNSETTTGMPLGATETPAHDESSPPADPNPAWGAKYAQWYDLIHVDHDYHGAAASYDHIIRDRFGTKPVKVLDFGCGTGVFGHFLQYALPNGSTVVGYDDSEDMLEQGRARTRADLFTRALPDGPFDVIVAHFNVVNYISHFQEWAQMMDSRLAENGLLIFDALDAEDVLRRGPEQWSRRCARERYSAHVRCEPRLTGAILGLRYVCAILKNRQSVDEFDVRHTVCLHLLTDIVGALTLAGRKYLSVDPFGGGRLYTSRRTP